MSFFPEMPKKPLPLPLKFKHVKYKMPNKPLPLNSKSMPNLPSVKDIFNNSSSYCHKELFDLTTPFHPTMLYDILDPRRLFYNDKNQN